MENAPAGKGILRFEKTGERTSVVDSFSKSPLKILTPKNNGKAAWVYSSNFGGGFVGGDAIHIDLHLKPATEVAFLSQASTKVYGSEKECLQTVQAEVERDAVLFSLPDPVVCFAGAKFHQEQTFHLGVGSSLMVLDTLHCGREHSGERWLFDSYKNKISIFRNNKRVFVESLLLRGDIGELTTRHSRYNGFSMLVMMGPVFKENIADILCSMQERIPGKQEDFIFAVSPHGDDGLVMRMAAVSPEALGEAIKEILDFVPSQLGDDPWIRKW
jgi:urease accessory protein